MSTFCRCGALASHRIHRHQLDQAYQPVRSKAPVWCLDCATVEADRLRQDQAADHARAETFDPLTRKVFRTDVPLSNTDATKIRMTVRRRPAVINPLGLVTAHQRDGYVFVELYPPHDEAKAATWDPRNCLFLIRYLTRLPLVFVPVNPDDSPSPATWRAHARRSASSPQLPLIRSESEP